MKKIQFIFLLVSLLCIFNAKASPLLYITEYLPPTDTVPYVFHGEEGMDYNDSLVTFPAYDLYCGWDTHTIHVAKFNVESLKDSTRTIYLTTQNSCGFVEPFTGNVTCGFGQRKRYFHYGTDIDLETGDAVGAAFDGKVRIAQKSKTYGNVVVIRHPNGLETYYAHLSKIKVEVGQEIRAGDVLGLGGNTGRSRGSHLHFEVRYLGQPINPADIISFTEHRLINDTLCLSRANFEYIFQAKKQATKYGTSKIYTVKKGDTLASIARRYGTNTTLICKKNGIKITATLRLGQKLRV